MQIKLVRIPGRVQQARQHVRRQNRAPASSASVVIAFTPHGARREHGHARGSDTRNFSPVTFSALLRTLTHSALSRRVPSNLNLFCSPRRRRSAAQQHDSAQVVAPTIDQVCGPSSTWQPSLSPPIATARYIGCIVTHRTKSSTHILYSPFSASQRPLLPLLITSVADSSMINIAKVSDWLTQNTNEHIYPRLL
jgi:hypothetical protein